MSNNGGITQVGEYDVLVGRGQSKFTHQGNVILRYKIAAILPYYKNTNSRKCKSVVANHVTHSVLLHGGRFLQQVPKNQQRGKEKEWIDIGFEGGITKVCFSFRDAVRNRVKLVKDLLFQDDDVPLKKNGNQDESGCRRWRSHYQVREMMSSFDAQHKTSGLFSFIDDDAEEVISPFATVSSSSCKKPKKRGKKTAKSGTKRSSSKSLSSSSKQKKNPNQVTSKKRKKTNETCESVALSCCEESEPLTCSCNIPNEVSSPAGNMAIPSPSYSPVTHDTMTNHSHQKGEEEEVNMFAPFLESNSHDEKHQHQQQHIKPVLFDVENEEQDGLEPFLCNPQENNHLISEMKFLSSIFGNGRCSSKEGDELSTFHQCWTLTDDDEDSFCSTEQNIQSNNKVNSKKQQQQFHSNEGMDDESSTMLSECSDVSSEDEQSVCYSVDLIDAADDVLALL